MRKLASGWLRCSKECAMRHVLIWLSKHDMARSRRFAVVQVTTSSPEHTYMYTTLHISEFFYLAAPCGIDVWNKVVSETNNRNTHKVSTCPTRVQTYNPNKHNTCAMNTCNASRKESTHAQHTDSVIGLTSLDSSSQTHMHKRMYGCTGQCLLHHTIALPLSMPPLYANRESSICKFSGRLLSTRTSCLFETNENEKVHFGLRRQRGFKQYRSIHGCARKRQRRRTSSGST